MPASKCRAGPSRASKTLRSGAGCSALEHKAKRLARGQAGFTVGA